MTAGGAAATGGGAAATGGGAAATGGAVLTGPGWLAIGAAVVVTAVTVIAVGELYKWATAKPPTEPPAVTKPAPSSSNDALEPDQWSDSYKKKGLQSDIDEFITPQKPATSGGSRGTGSSQAPAQNSKAPTGTSEKGGSDDIQIAANPVATPSETPSETPLPPPDPGGEGSGGGGGGGSGSGMAPHETPAGVEDGIKTAAAPPPTGQQALPPDPSIGGAAHPPVKSSQTPPPQPPPMDPSMGGAHPT
jgi:hypothetical protein